MTRGQKAGPERYVLVLALLVPLALMAWVVMQVPGMSLAAPTTLERDAASVQLSRPKTSTAAPPPTLAPRPTPQPTAAPAQLGAVPSPTASAQGRTYTVQKGDELRHIAANYGVSIWRIIDTNDVPNPDSLRVGQVLRIPDD